MPVAALPGNVRLRKFQLGVETTFGTSVPATRRFPWTYAPKVDPHWTFPVADTGTLDEAINPYRAAGDYTGTATGSLAYNDLPALWSALIKSGVTPSANVWTYQPASTSQDSFEIFSAEWGDETTDVYGFGDGVLDKLKLDFPENLGPVAISADFRFASVTYPITPAALSVDLSPAWVYAADTSYYIDSTAGGIGGTKLSNTFHMASLEIANNLDVKRFQNGSNTRFQAAGYGRGKRTFTATFTMAKSTAGLAEISNWLNQNPVERFIEVKTISPQIVTGSTPYSQDLKFAGYWFTDTAGTYATANTTNVLVCQGFLDQTLGYPFKATVTNSLASL